LQVCLLRIVCDLTLAASIVQHIFTATSLTSRLLQVCLLHPDLLLNVEHIVCDPDRVRGVLLNLYTNAAKFTKTGHIGLRVRLCATVRVCACVRVCVCACVCVCVCGVHRGFVYVVRVLLLAELTLCESMWCTSCTLSAYFASCLPWECSFTVCEIVVCIINFMYLRAGNASKAPFQLHTGDTTAALRNPIKAVT